MTKLALVVLLVVLVVITRVHGQGQEKERRNEHEPGNTDGGNQNEKRERNVKNPTRKIRRVVSRNNNGKQNMLFWQRRMINRNKQNNVRNYRRIPPKKNLQHNTSRTKSTVEKENGKAENGGSGGNGSGNEVENRRTVTLPIAKRFLKRNSPNSPKGGGKTKMQQYRRKNNNNNRWNRRWNVVNRRRVSPVRRYYYPRTYGRYYQYGPYTWYWYGNKWRLVRYNKMYGRYRRPTHKKKTTHDNQGD